MRTTVVAYGPTVRILLAQPQRHVMCAVTNPSGHVLEYATHRQVFYPDGEFKDKQVYTESHLFGPGEFLEAFQDWQHRVALQLTEYTEHCEREVAKLDLLRQVYDALENHSPASEQERILSMDLMCLMGAILKDTQCSWPERRAIVQVLKQRFDQTHTVFQHVKVEA